MSMFYFLVTLPLIISSLPLVELHDGCIFNNTGRGIYMRYLYNSRYIINGNQVKFNKYGAMQVTGYSYYTNSNITISNNKIHNNTGSGYYIYDQYLIYVDFAYTPESFIEITGKFFRIFQKK